MGNQKVLVFETQFKLMRFESMSKEFCRIMGLFVHACWIWLCNFINGLFKPIVQALFRQKADENSQREDLIEYSLFQDSIEGVLSVSENLYPEKINSTEEDRGSSIEFQSDRIGDTEDEQSKDEMPHFEKSSEIVGAKSKVSNFSDGVPSNANYFRERETSESINRDEFLSENDIKPSIEIKKHQSSSSEALTGFITEPVAINFREEFLHSNESSMYSYKNNQFPSEKDLDESMDKKEALNFSRKTSKEEAVVTLVHEFFSEKGMSHEEQSSVPKNDSLSENDMKDEVTMSSDPILLCEKDLSQEEQTASSEHEILRERDILRQEAIGSPENDFLREQTVTSEETIVSPDPVFLYWKDISHEEHTVISEHDSLREKDMISEQTIESPEHDFLREKDVTSEGTIVSPHTVFLYGKDISHEEHTVNSEHVSLREKDMISEQTIESPEHDFLREKDVTSEGTIVSPDRVFLYGKDMSHEEHTVISEHVSLRKKDMISEEIIVSPEHDFLRGKDMTGEGTIVSPEYDFLRENDASSEETNVSPVLDFLSEKDASDEPIISSDYEFMSEELLSDEEQFLSNILNKPVPDTRTYMEKIMDSNFNYFSENREFHRDQIFSNEKYHSFSPPNSDFTDDFKEPDKTQFKNLNSEENEGSEVSLEALWEHQDLIEQLRSEIRKVRATGLPTIMEESECPKMVDDLKPWSFEEKLLQEDPIDELEKFYKSYRERMRKFDILNYQKMYAMGFPQSKDHLRSVSLQKSSILLQNFGLCRGKRSEKGPSLKFIKELQSELETVYVGQVCLSWEFLQWQYLKFREVRERPYSYDQIAMEFQQFQVLLQRFMENERFEGPRIQNYVNNRCVLRNLLQVPLVKEGESQERERTSNENKITSTRLVEIMEESLRVFSEFVRSDREDAPTVLKGFLRPQIEFHDPTDAELFTQIQATLAKKERRIRDLQRSGTCLIKKFNHKQDDGSNQTILFSQIDMKLVSRVLKMSKLTTDELVWCQKKLDRIHLKDRKVYREPSFLLFPC
ncbi:hypothetical protein AMTRI_Chr04g252980 [Amborella trichopoda]